ncbi:thymic stromal lymphopoietin [Phyllostomus hastatus]|uniref:thymic stromal lymphopoietin n=1 Tax=Phyllostomus hastatus TaxID=9423 RepID=UPI001E684BB3|nr:thymic stromal lymphopoietin [Phyllostomus hastatus]
MVAMMMTTVLRKGLPVQIRNLHLFASLIPEVCVDAQAPTRAWSSRSYLGWAAWPSALDPARFPDRCALDSTFPGCAPLSPAPRCRALLLESRVCAFTFSLKSVTVNVVGLWIIFRKIFTLQLVGLVLTYNFHDCDFERIRKDYENIIFKDLKLYVNGTTCIGCNIESCDSPVSSRAALLPFPRHTRHSREGLPCGGSAVCALATTLLPPLRGVFIRLLTRDLLSLIRIPFFVSRACHCPLTVSLISDQHFFVLYPTLAFCPCLVNFAAREQPACLSRIAHFTFSDPRCKSLAKKTFSVKTNATLTQECPGYSGMQANNTQAMMRRKKREDTKNACLEIASNLIGLWGRFARS